MNRMLLLLALGACLSSVVFAQARPPIPSVVLDHMNDLDQRCVAAGGRAGGIEQDGAGDEAGELDDACARLASNPGMIASFSRGLLQDLRKGQSDAEFDAVLGKAIDQIASASV